MFTSRIFRVGSPNYGISVTLSYRIIYFIYLHSTSIVRVRQIYDETRVFYRWLLEKEIVLFVLIARLLYLFDCKTKKTQTKIDFIRNECLGRNEITPRMVRSRLLSEIWLEHAANISFGIYLFFLGRYGRGEGTNVKQNRQRAENYFCAHTTRCSNVVPAWSINRRALTTAVPTVHDFGTGGVKDVKAKCAQPQSHL